MSHSKRTQTIAVSSAWLNHGEMYSQLKHAGLFKNNNDNGYCAVTVGGTELLSCNECLTWKHTTKLFQTSTKTTLLRSIFYFQLKSSVHCLCLYDFIKNNSPCWLLFILFVKVSCNSTTGKNYMLPVGRHRNSTKAFCYDSFQHFLHNNIREFLTKNYKLCDHLKFF